MKELSIEEKAKRYDEAIKVAKEMYFDAQIDIRFKANLEKLFSEIKEMKDERIRKEFIELISCMHDADPRKKDWLAWLEKQGQTSTKKDVDDVYHKDICDTKQEFEKQGTPKEVTLTYEGETGNGNITAVVTKEIQLPKFKVGDWVTCKGLNTAKIIKIDGDYYEVEFTDGLKGFPNIDYVDRNFYYWTIENAKDGDVLADKDNNIGIFQECAGLCWDSYLYLGCDGKLRGFSIGGSHEQTNAHPATKEQRDLLFQKMKEAGYEFDFEKKELKIRGF